MVGCFYFVFVGFYSISLQCFCFVVIYQASLVELDGA